MGFDNEVWELDAIATPPEQRNEARSWARYYHWDCEALISCLNMLINRNRPRLFDRALLELPEHLRKRIVIPGERRIEGPR